MRPRPSLARRFLFAVIFLAAGSAILMAIAWWKNPPERCVERGGTWHWDGRHCEESGNDA
ncbi:hypothetical protein [Hyphobacterium sp.]|uniref:hypothetical protein n=1 Tax=Hyphobacterium sp. TaxID=2004662 RepID=UPI003749004D